MLFYIGTADNIIGFTKQKKYRVREDLAGPTIDDVYNSESLAGLESCIHANTVAVSAITMDLEMIWAADHMIPHYYMGSGYENSSEYKASWRGFEWWTGTQWTTNKKQYRRLCKRDSSLNEFSSLGNLSLIRGSV